MKHLIGVCLKDSCTVNNGYVSLTDSNCVLDIFYIEDTAVNAKGGGFVVRNCNSKQFLADIGDFDEYGYIEYDQDDDNLFNPINTVKKLDKYVRENSVTTSDRYAVAKHFRNTSDIVLFTRNTGTTYLGEYKDTYYFWRSPKITWIACNANKKLGELKPASKGKTKYDKLLPSALRVLFSKEDLKADVLATYKNLIGVYGLSRERAVDFILQTFMYRNKRAGLEIDREKAIRLLCLDKRDDDTLSQELMPFDYKDFSAEYAEYSREDKAKYTMCIRRAFDNFREDIERAISEQLGDSLENKKEVMGVAVKMGEEKKLEASENVLDEIFNDDTGHKEPLTEEAIKQQISDAFKNYKQSVEDNTLVKQKQIESGELKEVLDIAVTPKVFNKREEKAVLDITKEMNAVEFKPGNPACTKCRGKGYVVIDFFGAKQKVKCDCVDAYYASIAEPVANETIQRFKVGGTALSYMAMQSGLIPRERVADVLDFKVMSDRVAKLNKVGGYTVNMTNYEAYKNIMRNVFSFLIARRKLDYSILISAPNGFGKTTFVYSCIKLMLINGQEVAPYISLFKLAQLRYDYMNAKAWRRSELEDQGYVYKNQEKEKKLAELEGIKRKLEQLRKANLEPLTDTEIKLAEDASYNGLLEYHTKEYNKLQNDLLAEQERLHKELGYNAVPFDDMTDKEKDDYILEKQTHNYTYEDYLNADILFCQLSVAEQAYVEISTLKAVLDYRGIHCKPTIIMTDRDIEVYKESVFGMATDMYLIDEMLTEDISMATYDRAYYVSVKKSRVKKTALKKGKNV